MPLWLQWYIAIGAMLGVGAFFVLKKILEGGGEYAIKKGPLALKLTSEDSSRWLNTAFKLYPGAALAACIALFSVGWAPIIVYAIVVNTRINFYLGPKQDEDKSGN